MKYVILETEAGQKLPIMFPDAFNHIDVATVFEQVISFRLLSGATAVSAGFVHIEDAGVHGESESLGGLKSQPIDAARIMVGDSVAFMPDELLAPLMAKLKRAK